MAKMNITLGAAALAAVVAFPALAEEPAAAPANNAAACAEEEECDDEAPFFEVSLGLDIKSAYVSHNRIYSDTPVAQYDVWLQTNLPEDFGWVAFDIWANQQLNKRHSSVDYGNGGKRFGGIGEFDYEIVYGNSFGPVDITMSHLWYTYPRCGWHSQKFWTVGAAYNNDILTPSVKFFWEYGHLPEKPDDCFMIDFALSHDWELCENLTLNFTTKTTLYTENYADYISGGEITRPCFGGWDNGLALSYKLAENVTLGASINYLYKIDHRVRHCPGWDSYSVGGGHDTHDGFIYGGFSVSVSF